MNRRKFIRNSSLVSAGLVFDPNIGNAAGEFTFQDEKIFPVTVSTWDFGMKANNVAWEQLIGSKRALDAVEHGIRLIEADAENSSVGLGGLPDRDGKVTLDACVMDESGKAGSVTFLQDILHPISVARLVMEKTPHVMLSGEGALKFALENGFAKQSLLTEKSIKAWEEWKITSQYQPQINVENHDTVGLLALDMYGNLSGGCSTSGLAYKIHGRVGDSPIIGAGLYVDNEVGAAVATGLGELVMRNLSSFLIVELMRNGVSPQKACEEAIGRIVESNKGYSDFQVGLIALSKNGETGAYSFQKGFNYALRTPFQNELINSSSYI